MYKGKITAATSAAADLAIPFATELDSNCNTSANAGTVKILKPGYYNLFSNISFTGVADDISFQFIVNGSKLADSSMSLTSTGVTDLLSVSLMDTIHVEPGIPFVFASVAVTSSAACSVNSGTFIIERVQ